MTHTRSHMNVGLDLEIITTFYVKNAVGRFSKLWNVNISKCIKMDIEPYISQPTKWEQNVQGAERPVTAQSDATASV